MSRESFISATRNILKSNSATLWDCGSKVDTHENLVHAIDALLATNVANICTNEQECLELLILGCKAINTLSEQLISKFSKLLFSIFNKQQFNFNSNTLRESLEVLLSFLIDAYSSCAYTSTKVDILRALSKVLYENGNQCEKFHVRLLNTLISLAQPDNPQLEIRRMAINCLGNLSARTGNKLNGKYRSIYDVLFANLNAGITESDEIAS
ncbi:1100_t:CDS:2, partial [Ambispora leptoticha]